MPYKSEKIPIAGTQYDRRRKLTEEQRVYIRWLHEEEQLSYNKLAKMFHVSKRLIQFVCHPEKEQKSREQFKERRRDGRYKETSKKRAAIQREYRRYKQQLKLEDKI